MQCLQRNALSGLNNLRVLSLHGNQISMMPEGSFEDLKSLTHMYVYFILEEIKILLKELITIFKKASKIDFVLLKMYFFLINIYFKLKKKRFLI